MLGFRVVDQPILDLTHFDRLFLNCIGSSDAFQLWLLFYASLSGLLLLPLAEARS